MIELTRDDLSKIIAELVISSAKCSVSKETENFLEFLWKSYKENKHIITIGVR